MLGGGRIVRRFGDGGLSNGVFNVLGGLCRAIGLGRVCLVY